MTRHEDWCYVVVYNKTDDYGFGQPLRVLWMARKEDAMRVCMDERTKGQNFFLGWTYAHGQRVRWVKDDGRFDDVLRDLGLQKVKDGERAVLVPKEGG